MTDRPSNEPCEGHAGQFRPGCAIRATLMEGLNNGKVNGASPASHKTICVFAAAKNAGHGEASGTDL